MKLLILFILTSCSTTQYYKASDVSAELEKNSIKLEALMISVETDFFQKDSFYQKITNHASETSNYFIEDLGYRIDEMKDKKKIFNFKSNQLKKINDDFFFQIRGLTVIGENDALFIKINNFSEIIKKEGEELINAYEEYQKSSLGFEQVALISKNIWNQNRIKP